MEKSVNPTLEEARAQLQNMEAEQTAAAELLTQKIAELSELQKNKSIPEEQVNASVSEHTGTDSAATAAENMSDSVTTSPEGSTSREKTSTTESQQSLLAGIQALMPEYIKLKQELTAVLENKRMLEETIARLEQEIAEEATTNISTGEQPRDIQNTQREQKYSRTEKQKNMLEKIGSIFDKELKALKKFEKADRISNPLKWFTVDTMAPRVKDIVNPYTKNKTDKEYLAFEDSWYFENIKGNLDNTVRLTPNGFLLQLENIDDVRSENGIATQSEKARYTLVGPDGTVYAKNLSYKDGDEQLLKEAEHYQQVVFKNYKALHPDFEIPKTRAQIEIERIEKEKLWYENDRKENPLKWFTLDAIKPKIEKDVLFWANDFDEPRWNKTDEQYTAIDNIFEFKSLDKAETNPTVLITINGFIGQLENKIEIPVSEGETDIKNEKARYKIIQPDGKLLAEHLPYSEAEAQIIAAAQAYQQKMVEAFKNQSSK